MDGESYKSAIIDFLTQKENILIALEIAERMEEVKDKLHLEFWTTLKEELDALLNDSELGKGWTVSLDKDLIDNPSSQWTGVSLLPPLPHDYPQLTVDVQQENSSGYLRIYYGIKLPTEAVDGLVLEEVKSLANLLKNDQFSSNKGWLGWKWTNYYARRKDFLLSMSTKKEILPKDVANLVWDILDTNLSAIDKANEAIKQAAKSGGKYP